MNEMIQRRDDAQFQAEADALARDAEDRRLQFMKKHRNRRYIWMTLTIISVTLGSCAFGWYLLMQGDLARAFLAVIAAMAAPILLDGWAQAPIRQYKTDYKKNFLPKIAEAFGGLRFHPERGVSIKMLAKTGVTPQHDIYRAEDCFMGVYKGVKVIFSEGRLYKRNQKHQAVMQGIFALLEIPGENFAGHTIITADKAMAERWGRTRWQKLQPVPVQTENPKWNNFHVFSDKPDVMGAFLTETLYKELTEAGEIFGETPVTAVMFGKKFLFIMIPHDEDMFEASDMYVPVASKQHALKCKKEIDKILELIDVIELFQAA